MSQDIFPKLPCNFINGMIFVTENHNWCSGPWITTWKDEKKRSMKSLARRRPMVPFVDSSVTKIKTTWWIPSRGIKVRVDLANLRWRKGETERQWREGKHNNIMYTSDMRGCWVLMLHVIMPTDVLNYNVALFVFSSAIFQKRVWLEHVWLSEADI